MASENPPDPAPAQPAPDSRPDHSRWNWLLLVPIAVPLMTFLFNSETPRLAGFPAFYWIQIAFIPLSVACTLVVYRMTRKRG